MHRCLHIQEILHVICSNVARRDLLAVALVCQRFYNASLGPLWREVPNFLPVLCCLPSDIWEAPLNRSDMTDTMLARAITPTDLERFRIYAHHVQVFEDEVIGISVGIYQALSFALQGEPVFPNLIKLVQAAVAWEELPHIAMLLGPHIREIVLHLAGDPSQTSLLPLLGKKYPALVQFSLDSTEYSLDMEHQMNHILPGWTQLQMLTIPHLPKESLRTVAGLPHLRDLTLTEAHSEFGDSFSPMSSSPVFPVLRKLAVSADTPALCTNLFRAVKNCPLEMFEFYLFNALVSDWHNLFLALGEACNKATLTSISVESSFAGRLKAPRTTEQLRPLLSFTELTEVVLAINGGFGIDDAFVREMAVSWPHLQRLDIRAPGIHQLPLEHQQLTLQGLAPLANFCPNLRVLMVDVNATHSCFNNLGSNFSNSRVETIAVDRSPISQPSVPWVAAYLSEVFPKLRKITWINPGSRESEEVQAHPKRWAEVMSHLAAYQHIRGHQDDLLCDRCILYDT